MRALRAMCETIHLGALGIWAGAIVMTGVTAAIAFPIMKRLDPSIPEFAGYPSDHWIIAAGSVMNPAFIVSDWIGLGCAMVATITLAVVLGVVRVRFARPATVLRTVAFVGALIVGAYSLAVLRPEMQRELHAFWDAARAGNIGEADVHRAAFDEMHPRASFFIVTQLVLVLWALAAGGFGAVMERDGERAVGGNGGA